MPFPDIRGWRLRKVRLGLVGEVCPHCDHIIFPPRDLCPNCGDEAKEEFVYKSETDVFQPRAKKIEEKVTN